MNTETDLCVTHYRFCKIAGCDRRFYKALMYSVRTYICAEPALNCCDNFSAKSISNFGYSYVRRIAFIVSASVVPHLEFFI